MVELSYIILGVALSGVGYLIKRKIESKQVTEKLDINNKILELNKKLEEQNLTDEEFEKLKERFLFKRTNTEKHIEQNRETLAARQSERANHGGPSNFELKQKASSDLERVKLEVKIALNELIQRSFDNQKSYLKLSHKAWEDYAEKQAKYSAEAYSGGTHYGLAYLLELENQYWIRLAQLQAEIDELKKYS